jgi:hypothetical protein
MNYHNKKVVRDMVQLLMLVMFTSRTDGARIDSKFKTMVGVENRLLFSL